MPSEYEHEHLLHPTVLDACFQTLFPAFPEDEDFPAQVMVVRSILNLSSNFDDLANIDKANDD